MRELLLLNTRIEIYVTERNKETTVIMLIELEEETLYTVFIVQAYQTCTELLSMSCRLIPWVRPVMT
jgi:hypothetical protein